MYDSPRLTASTFSGERSKPVTRSPADGELHRERQADVPQAQGARRAPPARLIFPASCFCDLHDSDSSGADDVERDRTIAKRRTIIDDAAGVNVRRARTR